MIASATMVHTITAGGCVGQAVDVLRCLRRTDVGIENKTDGLLALQYYDADTRRVEMKCSRTFSEVINAKRVSIGPTKIFNNQLTAYVACVAPVRYMRCRIYASGKYHIIGATCKEDLKNVQNTVSTICGTQVNSPTVYMVLAGFHYAHAFIDRQVCMQAWNTGYKRYGRATFNAERHAALKINLQIPCRGVLMVFRTGKIQITGPLALQDVKRIRDAWESFFEKHAGEFMIMTTVQRDFREAAMSNKTE